MEETFRRTTVGMSHEVVRGEVPSHFIVQPARLGKDDKSDLILIAKAMTRQLPWG